MAPSKRNSKKAPIPFKPDYDVSQEEYIKHRRAATVNGITEETTAQIPKLPDDASAYRKLKFFKDFDKARRSLQWNNGPKLFTNFVMHLEDVHELAWGALINGRNQNVANFDISIDEFKAQLLSGYRYSDQMDYLRSIRKPPDMTPTDFMLQFRASEMRALHLPDAPNANGGFSDVDRRRLFYKAMPYAWQVKFDDANLTVEDETMADMLIYFDRVHANNPFIKDNGNEGGGGKGNGDNDNSKGNGGRGKGKRGNRGRNGNGNRNNNGNGSNSNSGSGSNSGDKRQGRIQNSDPCPLPGHGNHTWGECRSNRYNNDYQANRSSSGNGGNSGNGNRSNQGRNDSNAANQSNSADSSTQSNTQSNSSNNSSSHFFVDSVPFCQECSDDPESFFIAGTVQEEFEEPLTDDTPADLPALVPLPEVDYVPSTLAVSKGVNDKKGHYLLKALLDHGGSHVLVKRSALPSNLEMFPINSGGAFDTAAGSLNTTHYVYLHDVILPEFSMSRRVKQVKAFVFDNDSVLYDVIFGRSFLNSCKIDVLSSSLSCRWYELEIPFHPPDFFQNKKLIHEILSVPSNRVAHLDAESHSATITGSLDTQVSVDEVAAAQEHLSPAQRDQLLHVLRKHQKLFDGTLGRYPKREFHIELIDGAKPYHCKGPYSVPVQNRAVLKRELERQCELGILQRCGESEWGMPMMAIPKKNGTIRTVDDLRELNKVLKRKSYPLPKIQDIFHRRQGYKYVTIVDITNCYYTYVLDEESSWLCVLVTPFGKYRRKRLPQGLSQSPDWAQAAIEEVFDEAGLLRECVEAFIDDCGVFSNSWDEHLQHLDRTLQCLTANGYTVNPSKCQWAVQETEWLGHFLTPKGIKPLPSKVKGVLQLSPPTTVTELRSFLGMVNYYRDFWRRRSHILAPLTALTKTPKNQPLPWSSECDEAFKKIKAVLAEEVLLYYPDPNKTFYVEPDASIRQLGATIYQHSPGHHGQLIKCPVAFFSRKLTPAQTRYPASDLEALCITEVFDEYRSILYGAKIVVRTDHRNLTQRDLKSHRLLHWRLLLEEFAPSFEYLPGPNNTVADALSRLPMTPLEEEKDDQITDLLKECLLFYPDDVDQFPLDFDTIAQVQQQDASLLPLADRDDHDIQTFAGVDLICRRVDNQWKIVLPQALTMDAIKWYHIVLGHCGASRLIASLRNHLWIPNLKELANTFVSQCEICQRNKFAGPGYGELPPRNDVAQPWEEVSVDLVGPWSVTIPMGEIVVHALTIIDVTTTLSEAIRIENKTSEHVAMQFTNQWLCRYPKPLRCVHDQGGEFIGLAFQDTLLRERIKSVPTSVRNPQSNAIIERMHKTMQDLLNVSLHDPPDNVANALELVDSCLYATMRALRSATHQTLNISPGALTFNRDMFLPIPLMADYNLIRQRRQAVIDENNRRANLRRRFKDYVPGDQVLVITKDKGKLRPKTVGPFPIDQVHVNGTITIRRNPGVFERLSIRRVRPFSAPAQQG